MSKPGLLLLVRLNCLSLLGGISETRASTLPWRGATVGLAVKPCAGAVGKPALVVGILLLCREPNMDTTVIAAAAPPPATSSLSTLRRGMCTCRDRSAVDAGLTLATWTRAGRELTTNILRC